MLEIKRSRGWTLAIAVTLLIAGLSLTSDYIQQENMTIKRKALLNSLHSAMQLQIIVNQFQSVSNRMPTIDEILKVTEHEKVSFSVERISKQSSGRLSVRTDNAGGYTYDVSSARITINSQEKFFISDTMWCIPSSILLSPVPRITWWEGEELVNEDPLNYPFERDVSSLQHLAREAIKQYFPESETQ